MLEPVTFNTFPKKTPILVIIDGKPEYEILQIIDSKINCWWACKLLYKVIWLGYENAEDRSKWLSATKLIHTINLVSDFHIIYSIKSSSLSLFKSHYYKSRSSLYALLLGFSLVILLI